MARRLAKRANKPNPREDRNPNYDLPEFIVGNVPNRKYKRKERNPQSNFEERSSQFRAKKAELLPRNISQERYVELLEDETKHIVLAMGPAGTGKTKLAVDYAIKCLQEGKIKKIVVVRPAVSTDENHGFLPGSLIEKLGPWLVNIMDYFKEYYSVAQLEKMIQDEVVEPCAMQFMRGRTFKDCIIIFDEAQNSRENGMKMALTRIGCDTRMFVTGDINQHDRGFESNGLKDFVERLEAKGSNQIAVCHFTTKDIERHPVIEDILRIYED